ncbi:pentapeptide repeat-containing protein [Nostoc sp. CHAB 5784]|uniref:pentapeptide repeat-containing protein n=1 Tax=Nostoc mirabile TaxID=2907820 RepID=UPI001E40DD4B|nr:pentapeptide repeat-containing protein [Nostoc mirabile]MCC5668422.1 pentapeptide repeat-containing protein [Nostoc mirabile CHAB5784]
MPQDFSGQNLRGRSFKRQNLEGANFSYADIRSADFTGANLKEADFSHAQAGLQRRWAIFLVCISWFLSVVSGFFSAYAGGIIALTFNSSSLEDQVTGLTVLIVVIVVFLIILRQGLNSAFAGAVAVTFAVVVAVVVTVAGAFAVTFAVVVAVIFAVAVAVSVAITVAGVFAGAVAFVFTLAVAVVDAVLVAGVVAGVAAGAVALFSVYIAWRAIKGDEKYSLILNMAIAFAALSGTSFRQADLTDANLTSATLKSTDFRKAILTRTCFNKTKKLDLVRIGITYLQDKELRQLLVTGSGSGKDFNNRNLRGLNLSGANLANVNFIGTDFYQSSLKEADLTGALLVRTQFESTDLTGATLTGACVEDWIVTKTTKLYGVKCKYIFMKLTEKGDKLDQMPLKGEFKNDDFVLFVQSIIDTVKLYHERDVNPNLALYVLQSLSEDYQCTLEIVKVEKRGKSGAIIEVKIPGNLNEEQLKETYYKKYNQSLRLYMSDPKKKLRASTNIENITVHKGFVITGDVSESTVADTINQGDTNVTGDRNINTSGGNYNERIERDYIQGNYYAAGQPQSLAQAAADIQLLLKQLEQTYPTTTTSQQMVVAAEAINRIESNPLLKERVINAVKSGGLAAFEKAIDNPAGAFIVGAIKGWQEVEAED